MPPIPTCGRASGRRSLDLPFFAAPPPPPPPPRGMAAPNAAMVTISDLRHNAEVMRELAVELAPLTVVRAGDDATSAPSGAPVPAPWGGDRD